MPAGSRGSLFSTAGRNRQCRTQNWGNSTKRGGNDDGEKRLFTIDRQGHLQDRAIYGAVNESERQDVAAQGPAEVRDTPT